MMNLRTEPQMLPVEEAQQKIFSEFKQLFSRVGRTGSRKVLANT